ncbi:hypothetical protein Daura_26615 [Dactylosporangium aurantiacum]|uniref:Translation initiation factor n=1 Tax=Dactylosporangium aurantiacum TaxID=35754 RepID=A0A9Q9MC12_9ACTN|nr:hypothetical protein [Dactylosporangium aurantiacum]MDG6106564.1 hypothetical protein [Dactylosporangium aurantiacum]UWZ50409.1 hypothetical protein Daura_26615 [Dactylosporangium aurantiacum]
MVAARTAAGGLSTVELEQIRDTLAAGRKPKVVFTESAGQIAGQLGQVVQLTDPELSEEWVVVRFGRDELPFSPADLKIAPKAAPARRTPTVPAPREETSVAAPSTVEQPAVSPPVDGAAEPAPAPAADAPTGAVKDAAAAGKDAAAAGKDAGKDSISDAKEKEPVKESAGVPAPRATPAKKAAAKPKAPAGLTVTLAYADGEWTVAANQGSKALAKPYVIKASEALKMVGMLDVPGVHEAVEEIVSAARAEAESQAERLRAELAEIEARLAELREAE